MASTERSGSRPAADLASSLQRFCRTSSAHGLGHLPDSAGHARYLWLAIVLALLVALVYNVGVSLHREAFVQPVKTENTWVTSKEPLPLPRTTFCDLSVFRQPRLDARNVSSELASYLAAALGGRAFTAPDFLGDTDRQARLQAEYESLLLPGENFTDLVDALSPACDDVIKACQMGENLPGPECCRRHVTPVYTIRGKCYQLADFIQRGEGKQYGILLTLSIPPSEFPYMDRSLISGCLNTRLGAEVLLDDPAMLPHTRVYTHALAVSPPGVVELRASKDTYDKHGLLESVFPPLHRCASANNDSAPLESVDNCPVLRLAEQIRAVCGCHWLSMPSAADDTVSAPPLPVCSPQQVFSCVQPLQASPPVADCPSACREHLYHSDVLVNGISPGTAAWGAMFDIPEDGLLFLKVYLKSLQYRMVRQWCQTGSELLAELGGHMGIFLGVSVVTICEALAALAGCLTGGCRRRRVSSEEGEQQLQQGVSGFDVKNAWQLKGQSIRITVTPSHLHADSVPKPAIYNPPVEDKNVLFYMRDY